VDLMSFNGYQGTVETSVADDVLYGKILFITDLVTYEAQTLAQLKAAFEEAVTDYLATCKELGKEPSKPCPGQFNVRVGSELHRSALLKALKDGTSLNAVVVQALQAHLSSAEPTPLVKSFVQAKAMGGQVTERAARARWITPASLA
jgi:predicted HicB family RNase H-like nuclease